MRDSIQLNRDGYPCRLQRIVLVIGVVLLLIMTTSPTLRAEARLAPLQQPSSDLSPEARQAALSINRLRIEAGLPPLAVHPLLNLAVNRHIHDMVTTGHYGHSGSDGSNVHLRITRTGYAINGWAGENWVVSDTVEKGIGWWMTDPPHRQNVLNRSYKEMGLGTYPHPKGWGLILVVDFTTGSHNQEAGIALVPENATAPMPQVIVAAPPAVPQSGARYTVQQGDTLYSIGVRYGLTWQQMARANGLGEFSVLKVGSQIVLPGVDSVEQQIARAPLTQSAAVVETATVNVDEIFYTAVEGDTIYGIALRHGVNWETLATYNNFNENSILSIGAQVKIPTPATGGAETERAVTNGAETLTQQSNRFHIVQTGDTLWSIAARYSVDWHTLMRVNNMGENSLLAIGQEIRLP
ncbi:MAG: LysM peptidoglycan-binding domain-containing protein [Caldilineaceae bacterium]|nr:LysM peptidoglycan-binding domain-containing protein [Caldilineaceae bacterium]